MKDEITTVGISLERNLLRQLDIKRADVPRSRYLRRLIEHDLKEKEAAAQAAPTVTTDAPPTTAKESSNE